MLSVCGNLLADQGGGVSLGGQNTKPPTPSDMGFVFFNYSRYLSETKMTWSYITTQVNISI